jgi:hypothetical protein
MGCQENHTRYNSQQFQIDSTFKLIAFFFLNILQYIFDFFFWSFSGENIFVAEQFGENVK